MKMRTFLVILTLLAVSLSACSSAPGQSDLNGTSWALIQLQGKQVTSKQIPTLIFKDGKISGNASCNSFGGTYERGVGDKLDFGELVSTMMACTDENLMRQESTYLSVMGQVAKYKLDNDRLYLYDQGGQLLAEFKKQ